MVMLNRVDDYYSCLIHTRILTRPAEGERTRPQRITPILLNPALGTAKKYMIHIEPHIYKVPTYSIVTGTYAPPVPGPQN